MNALAIVHWMHSNVIQVDVFQTISYAMAILSAPITQMNGIVTI